MTKEVGTLLHLAKSGRLILKAKILVDPGKILYDSKGRRIAKVNEIFGPVSSPYISCIPLTDRVKKNINMKLYSY